MAYTAEIIVHLAAYLASIKRTDGKYGLFKL